MRSSLLYLAEAWLVCTFFGLAALAPLRRSFRDLWLPAAPVLGGAFLVVTLHWTSLQWGTPAGMRIAFVLAILMVAWAVARGQRPWQLSARSLAAAGATSLVGLAGATLALLPNVITGSSRLVLATASHDAFYYISESVWLSSGSILQSPVVADGPGSGTQSPLGTPAAQAAALPLRVGQALVSSGIHGVYGTDDLQAFLPTMAAWVLFTAGAVFVAVRLLGGTPVAGLLGAILVCGAATLARAAYDQHADSLLGISMVTPALAAYLAAVFRRHPRWPAVVLTTGLIGCYTEYTVFLVPAIAAATFLTPGRGYRRRVTRSLGVLGLALAIGPLVWLRGIKNLLVSQSGGDTFPSPYITGQPLLGLGRALGLVGTTSDTASPRLTVLLALALLLGCGAAVLLSRFRVAVGVLLAVSALIVTYATITGRGYLQDRLVTLTVPFVLVVATVGWSLVIRRLAHSGAAWTRRAAAASASVLVLGVVATATANAATSIASLNPAVVKSRAVTAEFDEVASWVRELGGPQGERVTVAVPDLFDQMWLVYELRGDDMVSFVSLHPDYLRPEEYWKGEVDRYIVVGDGAAVAGSDSAVVRRSAHFRLIDTTVAPVAVVAPAQMDTWAPFPDATGAVGGSGSGLLILRGSHAPGVVDAELATPLPSLAVRLTGTNGSTRSVMLGPVARRVRLTTGSAPTSSVLLTTTDPLEATQSIRLAGAVFP